MRRTKGIHKTIFVHDPSFTAWGWVILSLQGEIVDKGVIKTESGGKKSRIRKGDHLIRRISEINSVLLSKIKEHNVVHMISELPHGSQNAQGAIMIGAVADKVQTIADCLGLSVDWFSEGDAKKCLFNKQSVTKQETINKIDSLYYFRRTKPKIRLNHSDLIFLGIKYNSKIKNGITI